MKDLYIMKIGGSVVTHKKENILQVKEDEILRIVKEIKRAMEERQFKLLVVHGAGPFGHKMVSDYGINNGLKDSDDIEGFVRTRNSMEDLNKIIVDAFRNEGLLGFQLQTSAFIVQNKKKIVKFDTEIIENLLRMDGVIPILCGDMVIDRDKNFKASVISGDAIIAFLGKKMRPKRVLLGTDVLGIFTSDPKRIANAQLIQRIDSRNFKGVLDSISDSTTVDVTEGMMGKLKKMKEYLKGTEIIVFDLTRPKNLYNLLMGEEILCTKIVF